MTYNVEYYIILFDTLLIHLWSLTMNNMLTILVVEDDVNVCEKYAEYVETLDDISIISTTNNATTALQKIHTYLPDAIILDLELHYGSGSGFDVLQGLKDSNLEKTPYILITTNNSSSVTYECARQLGADYIFYKHQENYTEKEAINLLKTMKKVIKGTFTGSSPYSLTPEALAMRAHRISNRIIEELNLIGISPKAKGYQYLIDAIELIIEEPRQCLCRIIGEKYDKSDVSVERAMQNAINRAWKTNDIDMLLCNFTAKINSEKGVPTITEFVYYYANKIKNEY